MDQPGLDSQQHIQALRGLERINAWSRSAQCLAGSVLALGKQRGGRLRLLDLATGGGDVPIRLWELARGRGLDLEVVGCDRSERAVDHARRLAEQRRAPVRFFVCDALNDALPTEFDVLTCSLFLHHLREQDAALLLERMARACRAMVLVNDLRRSRLGVLVARVGTRLLSRSAVVHSDGPQSARAAFTLAEVRRLAQEAGLTGAAVRRCWPWRLQLEWQRR